MNARLYDPVLGRFITPDSMVEGVVGQGLNRYSYVRNNPLSLTDPTGNWSLKKNLKALARWVANPSIKNTFELVRNMPGQRQIDKLIMSNKTLYAVGQWVSTAFTAFCGGCGGAAYSAYYGYVATGSVNAGLKIGAKVYVSSYLSNRTYEGLGGSTLSPVGQIGARAIASGVTSEVMGGSFTRGFTNGVIASSALLAYQSVVEGMTPTQKEAGENTFGNRRDPVDPGTEPPPATGWDEGSTLSTWAYNTKVGQQISGFHDWTTGTVGSGLRDPSNVALANFIKDHPVLGNVYNFGTMLPSAFVTYAAYAAETGNVVGFDRRVIGY